jgi:hypothetical protein
MSADKNRAEQAAITYARVHTGRAYYSWWQKDFTSAGLSEDERKKDEFMVNSKYAGGAHEEHKEVQWMLEHGWAKRVRRKASSGMCPARQFTYIVLKEKGLKQIRL